MLRCAYSEGMVDVWVCRRDMCQKDLTEQGMRQGVKDSDIFILFLTNSVLSRYASAPIHDACIGTPYLVAVDTT